jgi:hypothetical protein
MASTRPSRAVRAREADGDDAADGGGGECAGKDVYRREYHPGTGELVVFSTIHNKQLSTLPKRLFQQQLVRQVAMLGQANERWADFSAGHVLISIDTEGNLQVTAPQYLEDNVLFQGLLKNFTAGCASCFALQNAGVTQEEVRPPPLITAAVFERHCPRVAHSRWPSLADAQEPPFPQAGYRGDG